MDGWQCPNCDQYNDHYVYQCRHCQQPRPLDGDSQTPAITPWQQPAPQAAAPEAAAPQSPDSPAPDSPAPASPPPGRFIVFTKEELVARCEVCGRYPVQQFQFKGNQGMVVFRRIFGYEGQLCRTCAETVYRRGRRGLGEPVPSPSVDDAKLRVQPMRVTVLTRIPVILVIFGVIALVIWAIYR